MEAIGRTAVEDLVDGVVTPTNSVVLAENFLQGIKQAVGLSKTGQRKVWKKVLNFGTGNIGSLIINLIDWLVLPSLAIVEIGFSRLLRCLLNGIGSLGVIGLFIDQLPIKEVPVNSFENREFLEEALGHFDSTRRQEGPNLVLLGRSAAGLFEDVALVIKLLRDPDIAIGANVSVPTVFEGEEIELADVFASGHDSKSNRLIGYS